jgi:hypothetical protein
MDSVDTVLDGRRRGKHIRPVPGVRVVADDGIAEFTRLAVQGRARRVFIVSPWISPPTSSPYLQGILTTLDRRRGKLVVVTRPPTAGSHQLLAVQEVVRADRTFVYELLELHAKMYLAELDGGRLAALVGSANLTRTSRSLREAGVLLVVKRQSRLGRDLEEAVHDFKSSANRVDPANICDLHSVGATTDGYLPESRAS